MVWVNLANGSGQVVKGIMLEAPNGERYEVMGNKRMGINRYRIDLKRLSDGEIVQSSNTEIRQTTTRTGWSIVGHWHTPEMLQKMFNRTKLDPDANLPRPQRESFWKMVSKPGTHNYKQKIKLMKDAWYRSRFEKYFDTTISG